MNAINILSLIERRTHYPLGRDIGDTWVDEILETDNDFAYLVTTENLSSLNGAQGRNKRRVLFQNYNIVGIFGLSNPMVGSAANLMLLVLQKQSANFVLSGLYNDALYYARSYRIGLYENSVPLDIYPSDFKEYCKKIELWITEGIKPSDGKNYSFNSFSPKDINTDRVFPQHYSKEVYDLIRFLKNEQTVALSTMAAVIRPRPVQGERAKVIGVRDFNYPLRYETINQGWKTDTSIHKGDIICKNGMTNKLYLLLDDINEEVFAGANDYVIRPHKKEEAAYLFIYIQSDTGKTIMSANTTGTVLPRMNIRDWEQIPIIVPQKALEDYEKYFRVQYYQQKTATEYSKLFGSSLMIEKPRTVEDILDMEILSKAKLYKSETIREFLREDLKELNACFRVKAYKATLILCGSILEAVLIDWVSEKRGTDYFEEELYVTDRNGRSKRADLIDYINIIKELKKPSWMEEAQKAHTIRKKRNLVHAKLCLKTDEINETVCREVIDYLKDVLSTRGFIFSA